VRRKPSFSYGWVVLAVAFVVMAFGFGLRNAFSVFYPAIVEEFDWSRGSTALMFSLNILVYGFMAPVGGGLVDRFRPRRVVALGACVLGGGIALCSLAATQWQFYLLYGLVVAAGLSMIGIAPLSSIVTPWFAGRRGFVFGILAAVVKRSSGTTWTEGNRPYGRQMEHYGLDAVEGAQDLPVLGALPYRLLPDRPG